MIIVITTVVLYFLLLYYGDTMSSHIYDHLSRSSYPVQYTQPEGLTAYESGILISSGVDGSEIIAGLVSLVISGNINLIKKVDRGSTDLVIKLLKEPNIQTTPYPEYSILSLLTRGFLMKEVSLREILGKYRNKTELGIIRRSSARSMHNNYWYKNDINKLNTYHKLTMIPLAIAAFLPVFISTADINMTSNFLLITAGLTILGTQGAKLLYKASKLELSTAGEKAYLHVLGLRDYIEKAERSRFFFHFNPENELVNIDPLLPYSISLDVQEEWPEGLEDLMAEINPEQEHRNYDFMSYLGRLFN